MSPTSKVISEKTINSESKIVLSIKEFIAVAIFILSLGTSISGMYLVTKEVGHLSEKLDKMQEEIVKMAINNSKIQAEIENINKTLSRIEKDAK